MKQVELKKKFNSLEGNKWIKIMVANNRKHVKNLMDFPKWITSGIKSTGNSVN